MEQIGQVGSDNNGRRYVEQMVCKLLESRLVGNLVSLFNVTFQDVLDKRADIAFAIVNGQQFRKSTLLQIFVEGRPAESFCLCSTPICIHLFHLAELLEGKRIKRYLLVTTGKMRGQLAAEQLSIGTRDDDVHLLSEHTVHKQVPAFHILYLVEKQVLEVAINLIQNFKDIVQLVCLKVY